MQSNPTKPPWEKRISLHWCWDICQRIFHRTSNYTDLIIHFRHNERKNHMSLIAAPPRQRTKKICWLFLMISFPHFLISDCSSRKWEKNFFLYRLQYSVYCPHLYCFIYLSANVYFDPFVKLGNLYRTLNWTLYLICWDKLFLFH